MFNVTNRNTRKRDEICSKIITKTPERCHGPGVSIVEFENTSHFLLLFLVDFEQEIVCWEKSIPPHATRFMMENYQILAGALDIIYHGYQQSA